MKRLIRAAFACGVMLGVCGCFGGRGGSENAGEESGVPEPPMGFWPDSLDKVGGVVKNGDNFTALMTRAGLESAQAYQMTLACDSVFNVRTLRAGNGYDAYYDRDSLHALHYIVYHESRTEEVIFRCCDSLAVWRYSKPVNVTRKAVDVSIRSSLWNDMIAAGAPVELISDLSDIYAWTVDFFGLRQEDRFRAVYDEMECEGEVIGIKGVQYAVFSRDGKDLPAIRFDQGDKGNLWWNEKGESMRKAFLKAPLKFNRISSGFSYNRRHPVTGKVRPHTAVDYAAPAGTPVHAIGDGTVISAGWAGGGGNTVKIRHNSVYTTAYLHLSRYGKGIKSGVRVRQGDVIGYVGSTGVSTGPHLDFRVWKNGTPVNPLKLESPPSEPIRPENKAALDSVWRADIQLLDSLIRVTARPEENAPAEAQ